MISILERKEYGWCEFIEQKECLSTDQIARFYERQGVLLGLLYVLGGSDIHQENVISAADQPVLVDLEALFQPPVAELLEDSADRAPRSILADSVMRIGLLPAYSRGVQLGGLTPRGEQYTEDGEPVWVNSGTDEMHLIRQKKMLSAAGNLPKLAGQDVGVANYQDEFIGGFSRVLRLLITKRPEFLASNGPPTWFSRDSYRILLRNTMFYARTLRESYHPDLLRDAVERDEVFDHLWRITGSRPNMATVFASECRALWNGDIPLFSIAVDSCRLSEGSENPSQIVFSESGMDGCVRRVQTLDDSTIEKQIWFIQAAFATTGDAPRVATGTEMMKRDRAGSVHQTELISLASAIADRISDLTCRRVGCPPGWLGMLPSPGDRWMVQPIGFGLYNGTSGLAMFFAYLGAVSGKTVYTGLAREAVDAFHSQVRTRAVSSIGAFDGIGGAIYALSHLARLWNDQHLMSEVNDLVSRVISSIEKNRALDVGEGAAGCIAGLLSAHGASRRNAFLKAAVTCGEQIIRYWSPADTPLTGFAHGAAGISLALLELWRETGRQDFLEKAREVVQYERNLFSAEHGNWPDLRLDSTRTDSPGVSGYKSAWCHGAIGIGLARVRCQPASAS